MPHITGEVAPLLAIMARLRDPDNGCEWDRAQTFGSIAPYTIEEAYEVLDAIERNDMAALQDELGDLLLQVVFHAQMAKEQNSFAFQDVVHTICKKMEGRHPHIFSGDNEGRSINDIRTDWESVKEVERQAHVETSGALDGVAIALPALMRAQKLQKRAARTGFDWPDSKGARDKVIEELLEFDEAKDQSHKEEELGDLIFAVVNLCRHTKIDAESALRSANAKFEKRFKDMESIAGSAFNDLNLNEKEDLWQRAKRLEVASHNNHSNT
jgi:nucleoside triphosphate diphosphatase